MPVAFWNSATKPSAMYNGQLEIRSVPLAGPDCVDVVPVADLLSELHAAKNDPPTASAAAAAAPPPMKRRREVRLATRRLRTWGSNSLGGMATVPFDEGGRGTDYSQGLRVVEHLLEI